MLEIEILQHNINAAINIADKKYIEYMKAKQVVKEAEKKLDDYYNKKQGELNL